MFYRALSLFSILLAGYLSAFHSRSFLHFLITSAGILSAVLLVNRLKWLTADASFSAFGFGLLLFAAGGMEALAFCGLFLVGGSLLSKSASEKSGRHAVQVWANSGFYALMLAGYSFYGQKSFLLAALASQICAAADTASSGLGFRYGKTVWNIVNWKKVAPGTDGGVSFAGILAAVFTGFGFAALALPLFTINLTEALSIASVGVLGSVADSYLGGLFQNRGKRFSLTNDGVNALSTIGSGTVMWIIVNYGMV